MNKKFIALALIVFCLLFTGKFAYADKFDEINEKLQQLQEKMDDLENLKREVELLKEALKRESEQKEEQISSLQEQMDEVRPVFDLATTLAKTNLGGYFELHYNSEVDEENSGVLDFHRFVLNIDHEFNDWIKFYSELEVEHAFVEGGHDSGELELEQAYLDFALNNKFNIRAGVLLVPMGLINQSHEPTLFNGVERPFVDKYIIPTTWFESGVGFYGELLSGLNYQFDIIGGLDAADFRAKDGIRNGRQKAFKSKAEDLGFAARLEYNKIPGLQIGSSFYAGESAQDLRNAGDVSVTIGEADFKYKLGNFDFRGEYAVVNIGDARKLNRVLGKESGKNAIASELRGWYLEGAYHFLRDLKPNISQDASLFIRYEEFDTQHDMPSGFKKNSLYDRTAWTFGFSYFPIDNVVVKGDLQHVEQSGGGADDFINLGLGWQF